MGCFISSAALRLKGKRVAVPLLSGGCCRACCRASAINAAIVCSIRTISPRWFGHDIDVDDLVTTKLGVIRIADQGSFNRHTLAWRYTVYAEFSGVIKVDDAPHPIAGSVHQGITLYREQDGSWEARLNERFEKLT